MIYAFVFVIISLAAFIFVMLGLGGAMVYVPVLKWAGFSVKDVAIPLGLLLNGLTTLLALPAYARNKLVDWKGGFAMAVAAFVAAPVGAVITNYVPVNLLLILFAAAVVVAAGRMVFISRQ
ncbi:MAG: TSUP family transporter, partial [Calditrichota bacterium]